MGPNSLVQEKNGQETKHNFFRAKEVIVSCWFSISSTKSNTKSLVIILAKLRDLKLCKKIEKNLDSLKKKTDMLNLNVIYFYIHCAIIVHLQDDIINGVVIKKKGIGYKLNKLSMFAPHGERKGHFISLI